MSIYISKKPWESSSIKPTDENIYFNRRKAIKRIGLVTGGIYLSSTILSCRKASSQKENPLKTNQQPLSNSFSFSGMDDLYPSKRNDNYELDRELTEERYATHHNNFYEFINPR